MAALRHFCAVFAISAGVDSFLGSGRTGRVWRVSRVAGTGSALGGNEIAAAPAALAVKIAVGHEAVWELQQEHDLHTELR